MARFRVWFLIPCVMSDLAFAAEPKLQIQPKTVRQGHTALVRFPGEPPADLKIQFGTQTLALWPCGDKTCGMVGVAVDAPVGAGEVVAEWTENGQAQKTAAPIKVTRGKFRVNKLSVDPSLTHPSEEEKARIEQDKKDIEAALSSPAREVYWDKEFALPTDGGVTSLFGNQRTYNGEVKSIHFGVDLRANEKTPIHAANAGKVVLARNFFMAGNMVTIDHGFGVFSSYAHLSAIEVAPGAMVKKGDKIGMAGATGRVTGPHLHWATRVNGVSVDPMQFRETWNRAYSTPGLVAKKRK